MKKITGVAVFILFCFLICFLLWKTNWNYNELSTQSDNSIEFIETIQAPNLGGNSVTKLDSKCDSKGIKEDNIKYDLNFIEADVIGRANEEKQKIVFLNSIKVTDLKRNKGREPSMEKILKMPTVELWDRLTKSSFCTFLQTSPWPVERIRQCSKILNVLEVRPDFVKSAIAVFNTEIIDPDLDPNNILDPNEFNDFKRMLKTNAKGPAPYKVTSKDLAMGKASLIICNRCQILSFPAYFKKIKGHERHLLKALITSQEKVLSAQHKAISECPDQISYGLAQASLIGFSLELVRTYWPKYHKQLIEANDEGADVYLHELRGIMENIQD